MELAFPARLLDYLRRGVYAHLPAELWDRYLWLYGNLQEYLHSLNYGIVADAPQLYGCIASDVLQGVVYMQDGIETMRSKIEGLQVMTDFETDAWIDEVAELIGSRLDTEYVGKVIEITLIRERMAYRLAEALDMRCKPTNIRLYASQPSQVKILPSVRPMGYADEPLLDRLKTRVWPAYRDMIKFGFRFYGCIEGDRLVAMCGLCRMTAFRSEIIGVETFETEDRGKGYASAVCAIALREALKEVSYVSWSASQANAASVAVARRLGFSPMLRKYQLERV